MDIDIEKLEAAYMLAHCRLHVLGNMSAWTVDELQASFNLLPTPQVSFEDWCKRMGLGVEDQESDEDIKLKHNAASLQLLGNVKGVDIKDAG